MVMGDNGPFIQYAGPTGQSDRIYRGGKGEHLEGGVRVNAWVRWPGAIEPGSHAEDIVHITDLFTTFARAAGATDGIPGTGSSMAWIRRESCCSARPMADVTMCTFTKSMHCARW